MQCVYALFVWGYTPVRTQIQCKLQYKSGHTVREELAGNSCRICIASLQFSNQQTAVLTDFKMWKAILE